MKKLADSLYSLCVTIWVGGLLAIGYLAVPVLFAQIADRMQAGNIAAVMFSIGGWLGLACGLILSLLLYRWHGAAMLRNPVCRLVVCMLLLGLIGQFVVQPQIAAIKAQAYPLPVAETALHAQFARWHGVSSVLYLLQAVLGLTLVALQGRGRGDLPAKTGVES